jgi:SAM-dependent methyltransferase
VDFVCRLCGSDKFRVRAKPEPWTFLECGSCGVFWAEPMPDGAAITDASSHYTEVYYAGEPRADEPRFAAIANSVSRRRMQRIQQAVGHSGTVLDIGCGTGFLLAAASSMGWTAVGVEVSERAAAAARSHPGVTVHTGTLEQAPLDPSSFDAIVMSHVLEHVPDPKQTLREVARLLKPSGVLVLALPNANGLIHLVANLVHGARGRLGRDKFSCSLYPPSHLYAFNPRSLRTTLRRCGFTVDSMIVTGKGDPDTYPMVTWSGAGKAAQGQRFVEWIGRKTGRGSLLEVHARLAPGAAAGSP